jgi:hypothetical protein
MLSISERITGGGECGPALEGMNAPASMSRLARPWAWRKGKSTERGDGSGANALLREGEARKRYELSNSERWVAFIRELLGYLPWQPRRLAWERLEH